MKKVIIFATALLMSVSASVVYAGSFDGYYSFKKGRNSGDLTIKDIGNGKYHFTFLNTWVDGANAHTGDLEFDTAIDSKGNGAYSTDSCSLKIRIAAAKIKITQDFQKGSCDAGANVEFDGSYKKAKNKKK